VANQDLYQVTTSPRGQVAEGAITDPDTLKGRVATADIFPGEQLTTAKFSAEGSTSLANQITESQRAVTLPFEAAHGMTGELEPGDHIDVYGAFNVRPLRRDGTPQPGAAERPVLKLITEDVILLAVPGSTGGSGGGKVRLTVKVSDQDAADMAFTADNGILWAMLRPRANAAATSPDIVSLETVLFGVPPVAVVKSLGGRP
jgi:Flp pilus assembly protein CpaB